MVRECISLNDFCKYCAAKCCKNWTIFTTINDVKRIAKYTGLKHSDFSIYSSIPEWELNKFQKKGKKHIYGLIDNGRILQIKKIKKECYFLKENRCSIYAIRPLICRLYPYWFVSKDNKIDIIICIGYKEIDEYRMKIVDFVRKNYE